MQRHTKRTMNLALGLVNICLFLIYSSNDEQIGIENEKGEIDGEVTAVEHNPLDSQIDNDAPLENLETIIASDTDRFESLQNLIHLNIIFKRLNNWRMHGKCELDDTPKTQMPVNLPNVLQESRTRPQGLPITHRNEDCYKDDECYDEGMGFSLYF
ncbi:hypothetical protein HHI36_001231 [Cryptolaemus montrouzieri]|uniref:Uncharacterized protein n=1 Tax=Cryptolaemus montrouzieri TaxID=559131 RepID=A0ABD2P6Z0_9CUCU